MIHSAGQGIREQSSNATRHDQTSESQPIGNSWTYHASQVGLENPQTCQELAFSTERGFRHSTTCPNEKPTDDEERGSE